MDKMSERSSNLDDEQLARKRGRERIAYILCIIAQLLWAINGIQMKSYRVIYPDNHHTLCTYRKIAGMSSFHPSFYNIRLTKLHIHHSTQDFPATI